MEVLRMKAGLAYTSEPDWPEGIVVTEWRVDAAADLHRLLEQAYRLGGGEVAGYPDWLGMMTGDGEFDPSLCILAWDGTALAGAVLCWSSAFVKDLCVDERYRRRGLGEALLRAAMLKFRERGAAVLELKVDADNPSGADRLYTRCGFRVVERQQVPAKL